MEYLKQEVTSFTSSNITDTTPVWDAITTYTTGQLARVGIFVYKSLIDGNTGFNPEDYLNIKWIKYSVSNEYAMLDLQSNTKSTFNGDMIVTFTQTRFMDTVALGYYSASKVLIEQLDASDNVLWSYETTDMINQNVVDYWTYIWEPYDFDVNKGIIFKIPYTVGQDRIKITFFKPADNAECGFLVAGSSTYMGTTLAKVNFKFNSYALKEYDTFGTLSITKRAVQDMVDFETKIPRSEFMDFKRKIKEIYNDIIVFILDESETSEFENMITLGTIQDATPVVDIYDKSIISWSIVEAI